MFFGGGCNNNSDSWIWIVVIVALVILCCDGNIFGGTTAVAVAIHAATLAVTITKTIAAKIYCT